MNFTFKQLEAFYFAATLGSFSAAALRLHTTQSAISKRVAELESDLAERLLHRVPQGLVPTAAGQHLLPLAKQTLNLRERIAHELRPTRQLRGTVKLGATELTALTWLTRLLQLLQADHPELRVEPVIDAGLRLFDALRAHRIDMALLPGGGWGEGFCIIEVGRVEDPWMASPRLDIPSRPLKPGEFAGLTALEQSAGSAKSLFYAAWRAENGFNFKTTLETNSLTVLRDLTIAGMGVTQLPLAYVLEDIAAGLIRVIESDPSPPTMGFSAIWWPDPFNPALTAIAERAAAICDFRRPPAYWPHTLESVPLVSAG
ncbi:LysR family transcriptional regulator [Xylophilus sp.]|uniref:LysR family transcriptional regulator n=1 Tax=Xylophilus sp. TaxID=2653893 RepID=UPI0013B6F331|nr:LysR family transcriptional regulator [Xylophilus sp.]KAF1050003.1 MAG: HTH-type transcriptional regulator PgrR [Xylophilus sp.]